MDTDLARNIRTLATKLYIGNLPYNTTADDLKSTFGAHGEVTDAAVISDKMTGRSRGFGFVTMTNDDDAQKAITAMNGSPMGGRNLVVNEARPMQARA